MTELNVPEVPVTKMVKFNSKHLKRSHILVVIVGAVVVVIVVVVVVVVVVIVVTVVAAPILDRTLYITVVTKVVPNICPISNLSEED